MKMNFKKCNSCSKKAGTCQDCSDNPLGNQGEINMSSLDKKVQDAFSPREKIEIEEEPTFTMVYQLRNGRLEQTEHSKMDEEIHNKWERKQPLEESKNLSEDEKIIEAFS